MPVPSVSFPMDQEHVKDARLRLVAAPTTLEEELRAIRVLLQTITTFCKHPSPAGSMCVDCGGYIRTAD